MIRCVKLWTGKDRRSHFQDGLIELEPGLRGDALSANVPQLGLFHETESDLKLGWRPGPARQLVVTLNGTLEFETADGRFTLRPGDVLLTEDTRGIGHNWKMVGDQPWRRLYTILQSDAVIPFRPATSAGEIA